MNKQEMIQQEIDRIILDVKSNYNWKMTKTTKKALVEITELGLLEYLPVWMQTWGERNKSAQYIAEIIKQAKDSGSSTVVGGWTDGGDGTSHTETSEPSKLYQLLNEVEETEVENTDETSTDEVEQGGSVKLTFTRLPISEVTIGQLFPEHLNRKPNIQPDPKPKLTQPFVFGAWGATDEEMRAIRKYNMSLWLRGIR